MSITHEATLRAPLSRVHPPSAISRVHNKRNNVTDPPSSSYPAPIRSLTFHPSSTIPLLTSAARRNKEDRVITV